jgi:hypothetical protein
MAKEQQIRAHRRPLDAHQRAASRWLFAAASHQRCLRARDHIQN